MDKYDRQLRLWGAQGQKRLANTHILLIHASAIGSETLKNLVLPGIQQFTILDDHAVTHADMTNNFFVSNEDHGQPRAKIVKELLLEMNTDVSGTYRIASPLTVLQTEPEYLNSFDLVIATQCEEVTVRLLGQLCLEKHIPLLIVQSYGFIGSFRLQVAQHSIHDAKHDPPLYELRLSQPFPALTAFVNRFEFDSSSVSTLEHGHIPFLVILRKALEKWNETHPSLPTTFNEKTEFKHLIQSMAWGPIGHEVNFTEALEHAYKVYSPPIIPEEVRQVLTRAKEMTITIDTCDFWLLARSLADFVDQNQGLLPITGVVPDMTALTDIYVALQQIYATKAKEDADRVRDITQQYLNDIGSSEERKQSVLNEQVDTFCKNAYNLAVSYLFSLRIYFLFIYFFFSRCWILVRLQKNYTWLIYLALM